MTHKSNAKLKYFQTFYTFFYVILLFGIAMPNSRHYTIVLIPVGFMLSLAILLYFHTKWNLQFGLTAIIIVMLAFIMAMAGVNSGVLFGQYQYGKGLGLKINETPILIGFIWLMLIYCTHVIGSFLSKKVIPAALIGSVLMLSFDMMLEPVAQGLDMWRWINEGIPLQNYIAWFLFSFLLLYFLGSRKIKISNPIAIYLFLVQFVFFLVLNFIRIDN